MSYNKQKNLIFIYFLKKFKTKSDDCVHEEVERLREEKLSFEEKIKGLKNSLQSLRSNYNTLEELFEKQIIYF